MDIVDALGARRGTTCFVGAGGKKTAMETLGNRLEQAVVTATVRIPIFDSWVERVVVTEDPVSTIEATSDRPLGVVPERERSDRYRGYDRTMVDQIAGVADPLLVKADGARMRRFKAPSDREPQIPSTADTVVPIASVHVVGSPLTDDRVHRVDRVAELTGLDPGDEIRPEDVATVLASDRGGHKGVPDDATVIPLLNMVDDRELTATGREIASAIHDKRADIQRVVLSELRSEQPLVDVV